MLIFVELLDDSFIGIYFSSLTWKNDGYWLASTIILTITSDATNKVRWSPQV